jgi:hypothetical protein
MVFSKILIKPLSIDTTEPMGVTAMIGKNPVLWMASSSPTSKETPRVGFEPTTFLDMIATTPPQLFVPCGSEGCSSNIKIRSIGDDKVRVVVHVKDQFRRLADPVCGDFE